MRVMCLVKATNEVYEGYFDKGVDTICREKGLSTKQGRVLLAMTIESEPVDLTEEKIWME